MNNKTFRGKEFPLESFSGKAVVDIEFTFTYSDGTAYDFSSEIGLYLSIWDKRGGTLIHRWDDSAGLTISGNIITWNERNQSLMNFELGKYYYEIGYTVVDYSSEDDVPLGFGPMKFI